MKQRYHSLIRWTATHRLQTLLGSGALIIVLSGVIAYAVVNRPLPPLAPVAHIPVKPKPVYYSTLTGLKVKNAAAVTQPATAIMIENSPDARPQSGMKNAGIVYEAIAEGGITRFLTIHQQDKPSKIGPVRSVRPYFVDWLSPYKASVAHVGGSAKALKQVRNGQYRDIDQFFNPGTYWRATDRFAPHNVYTSSKRLDALNKQKAYKTSKFSGFSRTDGKAATTSTAKSVTINFSSPLFNTRYSYDKKHNYYKRFMGGVPHKDREKGQITPSVVIAMHVNESTVLEDGYRQKITTIGSGKATIFQNGVAKNVTWKKKSRFADMTFVDKAGKNVPLIRGQTWIAAVPSSGGVSWK